MNPNKWLNTVASLTGLEKAVFLLACSFDS